MQARPLRIGTRGSALALAQAHEVRARLMAAHDLPEAAFEIVVIKTLGDQILDRPLSEVGGKGLFTKEIEDALLERSIDLAVHSMKDMQTVLPPGLTLGAMLPREDVRDAFISLRYASLADLPKGATVGTSSLRRHAQVKRLRPDLLLVGFRGNVQTRLKKLADDIADATFLACAGLNRLGLKDRITAAVAVDDMLPAVAQGAIGIEIRAEDSDTAKLIAVMNDAATAICVTTERAFLARLEGSCRTPIAGHARLVDGVVHFHGEVLSPEGQQSLTVTMSGAARTAVSLGETAANDLLERGASRIMSSAV